MQTILQQLYKKNSLQEIEVDTLQKLTQQHPYFAVGHYLLVKKTNPSDNDFKERFQKALVYFHNPLWLQYQLGLDEPATEPVPKEPGLVAPGQSASYDSAEKAVLSPETGRAMPEEMLDTQSYHEPSPANGSTPAVVKAEEAQPERFSFQAYHTVDYFASQGIKLNLEVQANDKLGKQLKSFTEWLKTMRRLPESVAEEVLEKISDVEIVQFAADSLEEKEVVTEAMAEVLVKQEKFTKARDVYNKLSLLHPHKSAYFAAKIEDLKQH